MKLAFKLILITGLGFIGIIVIDSFFLINREAEYIETESIENKIFLLKNLSKMNSSVLDDLDNMEIISEKDFNFGLDNFNKTVSDITLFSKTLKDKLLVKAKVNFKDRNCFIKAQFNSKTNRNLSDLYKRTFIIVAIGLAASSIYVSLTGLYFIGTPLKEINKKIQDMKLGIFYTETKLKGHDELYELSTSLNELSRVIDSSNKAVEKENIEKLEYLKQLRHADRLTTAGVLTSGIAHEMGTPLNVILGHSSIIKNKTKDETVLKSTEMIRNQVIKMTSLIDSILVFCNKNYIEKKAESLDSVIRSSVDLINYQVRKKEINLNYQKDKDLTVECDSQKLEQVFVNLLMNSIDAMDKNGDLTISLKPEYNKKIKGKLNNYAMIVIKDNGSGIAAENLNKIFDPFFTTKDIGEGTGLGLSISAGIIEEHGGWIDVDSKPGKGTEFQVYIPLGDDHES